MINYTQEERKKKILDNLSLQWLSTIVITRKVKMNPYIVKEVLTDCNKEGLVDIKQTLRGKFWRLSHDITTEYGAEKAHDLLLTNSGGTA